MQYIKIGFTTETIQKRMSRLKTGNPKDIYCLCNYKGTILQEKELHKTFIKDRVRDNGEWFYPSSEIIDYINKINKEQNKNSIIEYNEETETIWVYKTMKVVN